MHASIWHRHDREDDLFLVHRGVLRMEIREATAAGVRERDVVLGPGGDAGGAARHRAPSVAGEEVEVVLFEPKTTICTGDLRDEGTIERRERH